MGTPWFAEFLGEVETYLSVLAPGLVAKPWAAAFRDDRDQRRECVKVAHENPFDWNLKEVSAALGPFCTKCAEAVQEPNSKQY